MTLQLIIGFVTFLKNVTTYHEMFSIRPCLTEI
jgi:hypothetical protein